MAHWRWTTFLGFSESHLVRVGVEGVKKDYDDGRLNFVHVLSTDQDRNSMYLSVILRTWSLETS